MADVTTLVVFQVYAVYLLTVRVGGKSHYRFFARFGLSTNYTTRACARQNCAHLPIAHYRL